MNVGMTAVAAVNGLVDDAESGRCGLAEARAELDAVEDRPPEYGRWLVVVALGLTAASLSRLFGGDWPTFAVIWLVGAAGTWLRQELGRHRLNPIVIPFAAASVSGIIGGGAVLLGASGTPSLCLVAPGMIIVPGVPLINGVQDMRYMASAATSAGEGAIQIIFEPGTDPNVAVVNVNNRIAIVKNRLNPPTRYPTAGDPGRKKATRARFQLMMRASWCHLSRIGRSSKKRVNAMQTMLVASNGVANR